jgi:hypothetical protein
MSDHRKQSIVALTLNGGRVTFGFREALFAAAARAGTSVNEFVLRSTGRQLVASGYDFDGVFDPGDMAGVNDNSAPDGGRAA